MKEEIILSGWIIPFRVFFFVVWSYVTTEDLPDWFSSSTTVLHVFEISISKMKQ